MGAATAITLAVALVCDLFLLPSLLVLAGYRAKGRELLREGALSPIDGERSARQVA